MKMRVLIMLVFGTLATACAPEPGSKAWCEKLDEKPKGDWSTNDATEYTKSCLFGDSEEDSEEDKEAK